MGKMVLIFIIIGFSVHVHAQTSPSKFQVIFMADLISAAGQDGSPGNWANNVTWLHHVKEFWGATGINVTVARSAIEPNIGVYDRNETVKFLNALKLIASSAFELDIYIRISMGEVHNNWISTYQDNQVHMTLAEFPTGSIYLKQRMNNYWAPTVDKPVLNITNTISKGHMLGFVQYICNVLRNGLPATSSEPAIALTETEKDRIKLIVPTISPDDETEFPSSLKHSDPDIRWGWLSGYSDSELLQFKKYLKLKYNNNVSDANITNLKAVWESATEILPYSTIDQIDFCNAIFNWHRNGNHYTFERGRKDFIDFRTEQLCNFIRDCAAKIHGDGTVRRFKAGIQLGSIYDSGIEFRGFYDFTPLVQYIDHFIIGDIPENQPNLNFAADYSRSVCNYWDVKNPLPNPRTFSTETNWLGYNSLNPSVLSGYWCVQVDKYYNRGANSVFLSHWGTVQKNTAPQIANNYPGSTLYNSYETWRQKLIFMKDQNVKTSSELINSQVCHLGCEQTLYERKKPLNPPFKDWEYYYHNECSKPPSGYNIEFPIYIFTKPRDIYNDININTQYTGDADFITNYMIINSPYYIHKYTNIFFTATSYYMPDNVYTTLHNVDQSLAFQIDNETFSSSVPGNYAFIPGFKDEYNRQRNNLLPWSYNTPHKKSVGSEETKLKYSLSQNYPNPFNPMTTIYYQVPEKGFVELKVFDILGNEVSNLVNAEKEPGSYKIDFDASNLASGTYFYQIKTKNFLTAKKMVILK